MEEKIRGNCENIEHLNAKFQEILGRNANKTEIRLFPYLIYSLQDGEIERKKLSEDERDLIKEYVSRGLMQKSSRQIACTKEFWNFITEITYDRYVNEVE